MVECKSSYVTYGSGVFLVLIDTWWNVNMVTKNLQAKYADVLIDTWWNVNMLTYERLFPQLEF